MESIVITPETNIQDEISWVNALLESNLAYLHIRKPHARTAELEAYLAQIPPRYYHLISVHHHSVLAVRYQTGLHISFEDFQNGTRKQRPFSVSVHTEQEFTVVDGYCDYAFISPVWDSISKAGYLQNAGLKKLAGQPRKSKLIALGGVHKGNIQQTMDMGFDGAAFVGAVWQQPDPVQALTGIANEIKQVKTWNNPDHM